MLPPTTVPRPLATSLNPGNSNGSAFNERSALNGAGGADQAFPPNGAYMQAIKAMQTFPDLRNLPNGDGFASGPITPTQPHTYPGQTSMSFLDISRTVIPTISPVTPELTRSLNRFSPRHSRGSNKTSSMNITPTVMPIRARNALKRSRSGESLDGSARSSKTVRFTLEPEESPSLSHILDSDLSSLTDSENDLGENEGDGDDSRSYTPWRRLNAIDRQVRKSRRLSGSGGGNSQAAPALVFFDPNKRPSTPTTRGPASRKPPAKKSGTKLGTKRKRRYAYGARVAKKAKVESNDCTDMVVWNGEQQQGVDPNANANMAPVHMVSPYYFYKMDYFFIYVGHSNLY